MRKLLITVLSAIVLVGCGTSVRIPTSVNMSEYNSVASKYMARPTFAEVQTYGDDVRLVLYADAYGNNVYTLYLAKAYADSYIQLIDKYLRWEEKASSKGHMFEKEIGVADLWAGVQKRFSFYSANQHSHYLVINSISLGGQLDDNIYFAKKDAEELRKLLINFKNGTLDTSDVSNEYN